MVAFMLHWLFQRLTFGKGMNHVLVFWLCIAATLADPD